MPGLLKANARAVIDLKRRYKTGTKKTALEFSAPFSFGFCLARSEYDDLGADWRFVIQVNDFFVEQADTAT